jgi:hypothetical protein
VRQVLLGIRRKIPIRWRKNLDSQGWKLENWKWKRGNSFNTEGAEIGGEEGTEKKTARQIN